MIGWNMFLFSLISFLTLAMVAYFIINEVMKDRDKD
jgi:large-conductance mechanosensitive channel